MAYYVYLLECADKTFYIGSTNDLEKRLHAHNYLKTGARYTRARRPVVLRYSERVLDVSTARKREAALKRLTRIEKQALLAGATASRLHT
jgi:putative endonuclease